jgi:hypothetical protein
MVDKICKTCGEQKNERVFATETRKLKKRILPHCEECWLKRRHEIGLKYYETNKNKILKKLRDRYQAHIDYEKLRAKKYIEANKQKIKERRNNRMRIKRAIDNEFKLRQNVSRQIRKMLKKNGYSKCNVSCFKFLDFTPNDLIKHLESLFEPWMTWNNYGIYDKQSWDDNNQSTWTWQIDHIIPQSILTYTSMSDSNFNKCWGLDNLRPLSSKQNFIRGIEFRRI